MAQGIIERGELQQPIPSGEPGLIPVQYAQQIIQEAAKSSLALSTFRNVRIPTKVNNLPVLDVLPNAQWVTGEPTSSATGDGQKNVTEQLWKGIVLTAEEIAAIVVIPEAVIEDATINLWAEIVPRIAESIGVAVDAAAFAGTNKPTSWPAGIIPMAETAGNKHVAPTPDQDDFNAAFGLVEADGFAVRRVYSPLTQKANFRGWNANGVPIYLSDVRSDGVVDSIYGVPVSYDESGQALTGSLSVVGDPTKAIVGMRTDMQTKLLTEAMVDVSAAQDGTAMVNLAQQDSVALRVRARIGFQVANPVTLANATEATRFPFATIAAI